MSNNQKHTVSTDALDTLGTIIDERAGRDAIHLAVEPVVAGERLRAGDHIARASDNTYVRVPRHEAIGIVDPFLESPVEEGQRFWLVVYPRTITSLRHVWEHPAFPAGDDPLPAATVEKPAPVDKKAGSEEWLRDYCKMEGLPYDVILAAAYEDEIDAYPGYNSAYYHGGDYITLIGYETHESIPSELWDHVENITGRPVPSHLRASHFSCSC